VGEMWAWNAQESDVCFRLYLLSAIPTSQARSISSRVGVFRVFGVAFPRGLFHLLPPVTLTCIVLGIILLESSQGSDALAPAELAQCALSACRASDEGRFALCFISLPLFQFDFSCTEKSIF